jgi:hypothetical protein
MSDTTPHGPTDDCSDAERRVEEIAEEYLDRLQAGETPDRGAVLADYPDLGDLLDRRLKVVELMHGVGRGDDTSHDTAPGEANSARGSQHAALPEQIGRYVILSVLGRGASSTVYQV